MTQHLDTLLEAARNQVAGFAPEDALALLWSEQHAFIDVRELDETHSGIIPGANHASRGNLEFYLDPASHSHLPVFSSGRSLIFVCGSGGRAALSAARAQEWGLDAGYLIGGMKGWIEARGPVVTPGMGSPIGRIQTGQRMSQAVVARDTVYLAGQVADRACGQSVSEQTLEILAKIDRLLAEAGSHKSRLLQVTIWLSDMADYAEFNAIWDDWISPADPPARACVEAKLARPDWSVELMVVAGR